MSLFRRLFYRKPPDGLFEICENVYVFDCCLTTDALEIQDYKGYVGGIVTQLRERHPEASILAFNFREGYTQTEMGSVLTEHDMTITEYPRQYEGCPLLPMEVVHHFLKSSETWLSLGHQNLLLMHCERGGWPVLAFMLAALLIYRKHYSDELKTLDMVHKQAPRELLYLMSPLNPIPSQLRYLQYVTRRNVAAQWPPLDQALTLDCIIMRMIPNFDGEGGCRRPIFRIHGQDPFSVSERAPKVLFSTPKRSKAVRQYKQGESEIVKVDINCHIQGDVVLECISLNDDMEREEMMFRVMFNIAFITSNILMLNKDDIDILWNAKDRFPKDFILEVFFKETKTTASLVREDSSCFEEKDGLPDEAFAKVQEMFSSVDWLDPKGDSGVEILKELRRTQYGTPPQSQFFSPPTTQHAPNEQLFSSLPFSLQHFGSLSFNSQTSTSQPFASQSFASQISSLCTQINLTDDDDAVEIPTSPKKSKKKWSVSEEICLAKAWGTISNSSIVGNAQKNKEFWEKTVDYYNAVKPEGSELQKWEAIRSHYYHIIPDVNVFSGWYNNFYENRTSGQSDEDVLEATLEKWRSVNRKKEFKYQHVWKIMRNLEKWAPQQMARHASKKAKTSESENQTSTEGMSEVWRLPMGQQRAKKLDKLRGEDKVVKESNNAWEKMLEIKSKEFERADVELMLKEFEELHIHSIIVASIKAKRNW